MYITYVVQNGDTLYGIARQYGISVDEIIGINNLSSNNITPGQRLNIYAGGNTYKVVAGDSLYSIAKRFGLSVDELKALNNLTNNNLSIGQVLKLSNSNTGNNSNNTYVVVAGDSLYSIGKKFGLSVEEIKVLNNLSGNNLSIGQVLIVGDSENSDVTLPNYQKYTVVKGDSLYSIAKKYGVSVESIKQANNLSSNTLTIGQVLNIPSGDIIIGVKECLGTNYTSPVVNYVTYTVKKGDNLYNIARIYGVSVDSIIRLNNLPNTSLDVGQVLKIKESD